MLDKLLRVMLFVPLAVERDSSVGPFGINRTSNLK
ncbi:hypothetical protein SacN8_00025 [Sulfolobus acidocaldarius N8]|uniref:Uncharacterized protein n=2 Tax=Sulfolobus acidocaldarius TaxID=2285 RepID=M1IYZ2_9CREN|nr:hypothetical protein SacN8_00025 [Sulfolobus acidocaldarius N8]AGE72261.1 hypothetical protein SacRon12I_00025 [Sulfolobus acidocaldarius Ron12/I]